MNENKIESASAALVGAVTADSAAMGLHWIYDTARLSEVCGDTPEFRQPDAKNYEGVVGVFAHADRPIGSLSRYGATVKMVTEHIAANNGLFNAPRAAANFLSAFGYGGSFVGYVDHPAAGALDVIRQRDADIETAFLELTDRIPFHTIVALGPAAREIATDPKAGDIGARLASAIAGFASIQLSSEQMKLVVDKVESLRAVYAKPTGVHDLQLPVLAAVIPVAVVESARGTADEDFIANVRAAAHITHIDDAALAVGEFCAFLIKDILAGKELGATIESRLPILPEELGSKVSDALARPWESSVQAAETLGMSCVLAEGLPLSMVTLARADSYVDAIRHTILSGGDSCGRGILVGALGGLMWGFDGDKGIPSAWIEKVRSSAQLRGAAEAILGG